MGIRGFWDFLQENDIKGEVVFSETLSTKLNDQPTIAVDFIGIFHSAIRRHFFLVEQPDYDEASAKVLSEAEVLFPEKEKVKLFINGFHTVERNARSLKRNKWRMYAYNALTRMLIHDRYDIPQIKEHMEQVFHVSIRMRKSLARVAEQLGWQTVYANGDADVDIAKQGGTVLTNDSDLFFFKTMSGVILHQPDEEEKGRFVYYDKKLVLDKLSLCEEKWIALGIVLSNDFCLFKTDLEIDTTYTLLRDEIDEEGDHLIESYIKAISLKYHIVLNENETRMSNYRIAFQIYVEMKQHLMDYNNIAEYYEDIIVQRPFYHFLKGLFFLVKM